jgi:hypothetical protein
MSATHGCKVCKTIILDGLRLGFRERRVEFEAGWVARRQYEADRLDLADDIQARNANSSSDAPPDTHERPAP